MVIILAALGGVIVAAFAVAGLLDYQARRRGRRVGMTTQDRIDPHGPNPTSIEVREWPQSPS
jgi:hypothetical protein